MEFLNFDPEKCTLCGNCVDVCPFGSLRWKNRELWWTIPAACADCACASAGRRGCV